MELTIKLGSEVVLKNGEKFICAANTTVHSENDVIICFGKKAGSYAHVRYNQTAPICFVTVGHTITKKGTNESFIVKETSPVYSLDTIIAVVPVAGLFEGKGPCGSVLASAGEFEQCEVPQEETLEVGDTVQAKYDGNCGFVGRVVAFEEGGRVICISLNAKNPGRQRWAYKPSEIEKIHMFKPVHGHIISIGHNDKVYPVQVVYEINNRCFRFDVLAENGVVTLSYGVQEKDNVSEETIMKKIRGQVQSLADRGII